VVGRAGALRVTSVGSLEDASELQDNVAACVPDVIAGGRDHARGHHQ